MGTGSLHVRLLDPGRRAEAARVLEAAVGTVVLEPDPAALSAACAAAERAAVGVGELGAPASASPASPSTGPAWTRASR